MREVGFWKDDEEPYFQIDLGWDPAERATVVLYLESGRQHLAWLGSATCRMGCKGHFGNLDLTDGTWIWPEGYAHYLAVHGVKPPEEFVLFVRDSLQNRINR